MSRRPDFFNELRVFLEQTQSVSIRVPGNVNQSALMCQPDEWTCLLGENADSAQRQRNGIRTLYLFLSEGYKRGIQCPKKVNENGRFSLVNAGIAQLVEQLICNQQVVGSNPTAGSVNFRLKAWPLLRIRCGCDCHLRLRLSRAGGRPFDRELRSHSVISNSAWILRP
jgi:hypothetical protein